jgi:hypothetical protein
MKGRLAMLMFVLCCCSAAAQDMPLSQIIKQEEGWKPREGIKPPEQLSMNVALGGQGGSVRYTAGSLESGSDPAPVFGTIPEKKLLATIAPAPGKAGSQTFKVSVAELPLVEPTGVVLWRDRGTLVVADAGGRHLWGFRVEKDGSLTAGEKYYPLRVRKGIKRSEASGLTIDTDGRVYAATQEGIQVFDPTGRLSGVLAPPAKGKLTYLFFDVKEPDLLCVVCDGKVYGRKLLSKGFFHTPRAMP